MRSRWLAAALAAHRQAVALARAGRERVLAGHTDEVMARRVGRALGPAWGWALPVPAGV